MYILGSILRWAVLAGYLISSALYISRLRGRHPRHAEVAAAVLLATVVGHALLLGGTILETGHLHVLRSLLSAMTLPALVLALSTLVLSARMKNASLGAFTMPLAALFQVLSLFDRPRHAGIDPVIDSYLFEVHLAGSFLAYTAFGLAFAAGIMYLALSDSIRARRIGNLFERLPSLITLDQLGSLASHVGLLLFTIGLISGAAWGATSNGRAVSGGPKEWLALATWLIYAAQALLRWRAGWQGRWPALLSIIGFAAAVVTVLGGASGRHPL